MRQNKSYPNQMKTRLYSEVEKALKAGIREVVLCLPGSGSGSLKAARRRKLVVMHVLGDRVMFFDPEMNPELSYAAELGNVGDILTGGGLPPRRYEGNGMHSVEKKFISNLFYDGKAYALIPAAYKLAV